MNDHMHLFNTVLFYRQLSTFCDSYIKSIAVTEVNLIKQHSVDLFQLISQGNVSRVWLHNHNVNPDITFNLVCLHPYTYYITLVVKSGIASCIWLGGTLHIP